MWHSSTAVKHLNHNSTNDGLNPITGTGKLKTAKFLRSNLWKPLIRQQERSSVFIYLGCGAAIIFFFDKLIPKMFDMQLIFWIKGGLLKSNCLSHLIGCTKVAQWSNTLIIIIRLMVWILSLALVNKKLLNVLDRTFKNL